MMILTVLYIIKLIETEEVRKYNYMSILKKEDINKRFSFIVYYSH